MTLKYLGESPIVLTKLDPRDEGILKPLKDRGIPFLLWKSRETTLFRNIYSNILESREQFLYSDSDPISIYEIEGVIENPSWIFLTPLTRKFIPLVVFKYLYEKYRNICLGLQGCLREIINKHVRISKPKNIREILSYCKIVSLNRIESEGIYSDKDLMRVAKWISNQGPEEVIITDGSMGGVYYSSSDEFNYTVPRISHSDPTGAGDIFISCYLYGKLKSLPPMKSVKFAVNSTYKILENRDEIFSIPEKKI